MRSSETMTAGRYGLRSSLEIILSALVVSLLVFAGSLVLQWVVYEDLLLRTGQWRITGTALATILTFLFLYRWQLAERKRQREMQQRLDIIGEMNDRIRNALQIIQVTSYLSQPNATAPIREAIDAIDVALRVGSAGVASSETNLNEKAAELQFRRRSTKGPSF
jgi:Flp pilus assembly protein TadB